MFSTSLEPLETNMILPPTPGRSKLDNSGLKVSSQTQKGKDTI